MSSTPPSQSNIWDTAPDTLQVRIQSPRHIPEAEDSLEFHAARILFLINYAGGDEKQIEGRVKLAKMDFLVRYPTYLVEAARIRRVKTNIKPIARPESRMIRYKYGPWDPKYYDVFAFLVAKGLMIIRPNKDHGDIFKLTDKGLAAVEELDGPEFEEIIDRCTLVYKLFGAVKGNTIKRFIYRYFSEVIDMPMGARIEGGP